MTSVLVTSDSTSLVSSTGSLNDEERVDHKYPTNDLIFVGKGNPQPSRYIIIPKQLESDVQTFADNFLLRGVESSGAETTGDTDGFSLKKPGVLISVTGGAQDFYMHSSKLEQVFNRGLLRAAQNIGAWIVDGGLDAGVMQYVGKAIKEMAVDDVPCIGIASHKMVILNEALDEQANRNVPAEYVANQPNTPTKCALNPNHTHFILVNSDVVQWGQEIVFRSQLEGYLREKFQIPVVLIVVNGGPGTLETVAQGAEKNFAVVVVEGSGRASDAVAALVRKAQLLNSNVTHTCESLMAINDGVDVSPWTRLLAEARGDQNKIRTWTGFMDRILANHSAITLFSANDEADADMDIFILRAILSSPGKKLSLREKLRLGCVWNRDDIVIEILETEKDDSTTDEKRAALNSALELSLILDRPKIFSILAEKGAQKDSVDLKKLYYYKPLRPYWRRLPAYAQGKAHYNKAAAEVQGGALPLPIHESTGTMMEFSNDTPKKRALLKFVFKAAGTAFHGYQALLDKKFDAHDAIEESGHGGSSIRKRKKKVAYQESDGARVTYTDFLIWSIFVNRMELAKAIWQKTTLPVHSALLSCQLYRYLSHHSTDKEAYLENADWFEGQSLKMMDRLEYSDIKDVLIWEWAEMGNKSALDIAGDAKCKKFVCHAHVQSLMDELLYSDRYGKIDPTTPSYQIWAAIILPFFFIFWVYKNTAPTMSRPHLFYHLPIVKFWTNTFLYCCFLFVQGWTICVLREGDGYLVIEIILWIWVFSLIADEVAQYLKDPHSHFQYLSNLLDLLVLLLHVVYMILRWISHNDDDEENHVFKGAINSLIVACVFSWARLLNAFAISHSLGPLYFIIIRLFKDIFLWIFVFVIFAVSFQLGFISLTAQAGEDPLQGYPDGSFPVSFFTIIGDFSYIMPLMSKAPIGVAFLAIYALIAQVMLVNLLIAMMGDTYSNVSENSAEEWKFYRLELMMENQSASFHPPPTNLVIVPIQLVFGCRRWNDKEDQALPVRQLSGTSLHQSLDTDYPSGNYDLQKILKKMRIARDEVVESEQLNEDSSVGSMVTVLKDRIRTLANERENDRTFLEKKFKELEATNLALVQQNQQILALLQQAHGVAPRAPVG